jgi:hypothetical protein
MHQRRALLAAPLLLRTSPSLANGWRLLIDPMAALI